jgi:hypothetical protein
VKSLVAFQKTRPDFTPDKEVSIVDKLSGDPFRKSFDAKKRIQPSQAKIAHRELSHRENPISHFSNLDENQKLVIKFQNEVSGLEVIKDQISKK